MPDVPIPNEKDMQKAGPQEVSIPREKVDDLSKKLDQFQNGQVAGKLDPDEARILHGIFAVAADALGPSGGGRGRTDLVEEGSERTPAVRLDNGETPSLGEQFRQQFLVAFELDPLAKGNPGAQGGGTQDPPKAGRAPVQRLLNGVRRLVGRRNAQTGRRVAARPAASFIIPGSIPGPGGTDSR